MGPIVVEVSRVFISYVFLGGKYPHFLQWCLKGQFHKGKETYIVPNEPMLSFE